MKATSVDQDPVLPIGYRTTTCIQRHELEIAWKGRMFLLSAPYSRRGDIEAERLITLPGEPSRDFTETAANIEDRASGREPPGLDSVYDLRRHAAIGPLRRKIVSGPSCFP